MLFGVAFGTPLRSHFFSTFSLAFRNRDFERAEPVLAVAGCAVTGGWVWPADRFESAPSPHPITRRGDTSTVRVESRRLRS
ncbi:MAG: hypothetical protein CM1200mP2_15940 [Planctomycetaceae bacterium]|nr:MAG: hypothetical protein CM1200mP2_15940 [Planctomycetaceae bacterium]